MYVCGAMQRTHVQYSMQFNNLHFFCQLFRPTVNSGHRQCAIVHRLVKNFNNLIFFFFVAISIAPVKSKLIDFYGQQVDRWLFVIRNFACAQIRKSININATRYVHIQKIAFHYRTVNVYDVCSQFDEWPNQMTI